MRSPNHRALILVLAACTVLACAGARPSGPVLPPVETAAAGRAAQVLLLLPLNVAVEMPAGLEGPSVAAWGEIEAYLRAHGKQLKTVSYPVVRRLWLESVSQAQSAGDESKAGFREAASRMAVELRRHAEFDAVVAPSVFLQQARLEGVRATWDGVTRRVELRRERPRFRRSQLRASRTATAASLHVAVFEADGRQVHTGQGGLDLLVDMMIDEQRSKYMVTREFRYFEPRPEVFDDPARLRGGVVKAFEPFLPPEAVVIERDPL